ncbi:MAG TPA: hemolysin family protein [Sphingobium sp.]|nr:hemolysin family protein [Sphingobium sp.]
MAEATSSSSSPKEGDSSSSSEGGRIWRGLRALLFGDNGTSLREELEHALEEYEEEEEGHAPAKGDLTPVERQMVKNLLHFSEHTVDDVAVPRADIVAISQDASFAELVALFAEAGHSRIPVFKDSLDTVTGMIHIRDAFAILADGRPHPCTLDELIRQPLYVPQSMGVLDLLADMRARRTHLAIVLNEYSGTDGLVTIEDLVEEIVGDIEDEHDDEPEALLVAHEDGSWDADARAELDDVARDIDPALAEVQEDVDTLGGLAFVIAGHVPQPGEIVAHASSGWRLEVLEGDTRRVTRLRLHPPVEIVAEE